MIIFAIIVFLSCMCSQVREVEVFYVDTGTSGRINLKDVCSTLPPMLYGSPFQALQCSLQDVKVVYTCSFEVVNQLYKPI